MQDDADVATRFYRGTRAEFGRETLLKRPMCVRKTHMFI
jgi:hypothetical protein